MSLRIRRGTDAQRLGVTFDLGEVIYTTDTQKLFVGDGVTVGGKNILASSAGVGINFNATTQEYDFDSSSLGLTTTIITEGTNYYFTQTRAQSAAAAALTAGNAYNTGIAFTYDSVNNRITASVTGGHVLSDATPKLGGNLDLNNYNINGTGTININGMVEGTSLNAGGSLTVTGSSIVVNTGSSNLLTLSHTGLKLTTDISDPIWGANITGVANSSATSASMVFNISGGTINGPTLVPANALIAATGFSAYNGVSFVSSAFSAVYVDGTPSNGSNSIATKYVIGAGDGTNTFNSFKTMSFNGAGVLSSPSVFAGDGTASHPSIGFTTDGGMDSGFFHPGDGIVCVSVNATEQARFDSGGLRVNGFMKVKDFGGGSLPSPAEAGMIVLQGGTFQGYNGSSWVVLG